MLFHSKNLRVLLRVVGVILVLIGEIRKQRLYRCAIHNHLGDRVLE